MNKSRVESLSDGVISVSLTLMLHQIGLPTEFTLNGLWQQALWFVPDAKIERQVPGQHADDEP